MGTLVDDELSRGLNEAVKAMDRGEALCAEQIVSLVTVPDKAAEWWTRLGRNMRH